MSQFRITGQIPLSGTITISGRKNAALKLIAATILSDQPITLHRIPEIGDVRTMLEILGRMGATIEVLSTSSARINTANIQDPTIPHELGRKLRASLVLVGPLLARFGRATFPHPGGCVIGKRSIAPHLEAFQRLGADIQFDGSTYTITTEHQLQGSDIYLKERSVTGTENLIMAATRANGITRIFNAAEEPHISNLCRLLQKLGYQISGEGTSTVSIVGASELSHLTAEETIIPDEIEVGTFAVASVITHGEVTLKEVGSRRDLLPILSKLEDFNVQFSYNEAEETLAVHPSPNLTGANVQTNPWPGFPSDLQSPFTILATQATGTSLIHDWMYEGRLYFVDLLQRMGANIVTCDPHRALVTGPTPLFKNSLITPDLRAGAALVLAALVAEGISIVEHTELIDRGYAQIDQRLRDLGAKITRE